MTGSLVQLLSQWESLILSHESHDVDELGWSGLGHMTEPDHHKYKDPNTYHLQKELAY